MPRVGHGHCRIPHERFTNSVLKSECSLDVSEEQSFKHSAMQGQNPILLSSLLLQSLHISKALLVEVFVSLRRLLFALGIP